ncbi:DNA (cytosine-5-)-methyltransferase [Promethearchaeum syntrophicum]|uniref:DNA (Cytosine-5-)-methyltransferase n=1 Tax=Promethearchaeum syntrophicum TaxID=2594042 RepID=A0A5B9DEI4_9ARCH|nr:DNA (cytosine-5-)-methyltransferase [Candidatus Prometheoarchaeum syntrophicum]QEE17183.1 DNA cytosine methylase [Candidatus Prometheoarchaeum syntrophicum]
MVIKAIDLFAGIGGIRLGIEQAFGENIKIIYASEKSEYSRRTYFHNFNHEPENTDILEIKPKKIPDFDILLAGFPCQAFSIAGKRKGFLDERGRLVFKVFDIINIKKPEVVFFENVKFLKTHNKKRTFLWILNQLEYFLEYYVFFKVLNSANYNVPQKRERLYIVCFKNYTDFTFPEPVRREIQLKNCLKKQISSKYLLSQRYLNGLKKHKKRHQEKGNGFGFQVIPKSGIANTIVCGGMGRERNLIKESKENIKWEKIGIYKPSMRNSELIRRLTPNEFLKVQGFPSTFTFPENISETEQYKQIGNTVSVPVINQIGNEIYKHFSIVKKDIYERKIKKFNDLSKLEYQVLKILLIGNYISKTGIIPIQSLENVCKDFNLHYLDFKKSFRKLIKYEILDKITTKRIYFSKKILKYRHFEDFY